MNNGEVVDLGEPTTHMYPDFGFTCTGTAIESGSGEICGFS